MTLYGNTNKSGAISKSQLEKGRIFTRKIMSDI